MFPPWRHRNEALVPMKEIRCYTVAIQPNALKATTSATTPMKSIDAVTVGVQ